MQNKNKEKSNLLSRLFSIFPLQGNERGRGKSTSHRAKGSKNISLKVSPTLIYLGVLSLLFWGYTQFIVPAQARLEALRAEASLLDTNLVSQLEAKKSFLEGEKERLERELARNLSLSPRGLEEVQGVLYDLGRRTGLDVFLLKEAKAQKEDIPLLNGVVVSYELRGTFDQILLFFDLLQARGFRSKEMAITPYLTEGKRGLVVVGQMQVFYVSSNTPAENREVRE